MGSKVLEVLNDTANDMPTNNYFELQVISNTFYINYRRYNITISYFLVRKVSNRHNYWRDYFSIPCSHLNFC